jgi:hypothetical protein
MRFRFAGQSRIYHFNALSFMTDALTGAMFGRKPSLELPNSCLNRV